MPHFSAGHHHYIPGKYLNYISIKIPSCMLFVKIILIAMQLKQTHLPIHNLIVAMLYSLIAFVCHNLEIAQSLLLYDEFDYALKATGNITFVNVRKANELDIKVFCDIKHRLQ